MNRITTKELQQLIDLLNTRYGHELSPYGRDSAGKFKANPNVYHIDSAYGGVALDQMGAEGSGTRRISCDGFGTKRELHTFLCGMLAV